MTDHAYTHDQVNLLTRYLRHGFKNALAIMNTDVGKVLSAMERDGITVTFPEPPYRVVVAGDHAYVVTRQAEHLTSGQVASFHLDRHPDARCAAQTECDRLNREAAA